MLLLIFIFRLRLSVIPVVLGRDHPLLGLGTQLLLQIAHLRLQGSCNRYQKGCVNNHNARFSAHAREYFYGKYIQCCGSGTGWIRNFVLIRIRNYCSGSSKNERADKLKFYFEVFGFQMLDCITVGL